VYTVADHVNAERLMLCTSPKSNQRNSCKFSCYASFKSSWAYNTNIIKYHIIIVNECNESKRELGFAIGENSLMSVFKFLNQLPFGRKINRVTYLKQRARVRRRDILQILYLKYLKGNSTSESQASVER
jgi:hypothetical protein